MGRLEGVPLRRCTSVMIEGIFFGTVTFNLSQELQKSCSFTRLNPRGL